MSNQETTLTDQVRAVSFFEQANVLYEQLPIGPGIPFGVTQIYHPILGIGGAYGTWGAAYNNADLKTLVEDRLEKSLNPEDLMELGSLGFLSRHHIQDLLDDDHLALEIEVGARFLHAAMEACGWNPDEIDGVLIGSSGPVANDYTELIARRAGIRESALKVSVHKACDSSVGALHLALNPELPANHKSGRNIAEELYGKKVLVGGIEGLSRFVRASNDHNALQLFGNGGGVIGVIPGNNMRFLVGKTHEAFDEEGVLGVRMYYPHSKQKSADESFVEVSQAGQNHIRVAGMMNEPADGSPISMAGPMGMVKLFVRTGVEVVKEAYAAYQAKMNELGTAGKEIASVVVHHANLKINRLKEKHLNKEGIYLPMPWVISDFGNVSAASNMIAFLRQLAGIKPGDHILIDGFGAGTYYDVLAVELPGMVG
ncbi:MAG TPA: 3-oxoacyl-[acyl-carrier-protein] synthase III C-terminal domain-containing protein [Anaerolineales bacterium]|nr:3-oxoacyl-[acyl-carrier-protein] synthase III C-terminal domain-containing protein [Anaerolineales bacterium]